MSDQAEGVLGELRQFVFDEGPEARPELHFGNDRVLGLLEPKHQRTAEFTVTQYLAVPETAFDAIRLDQEDLLDPHRGRGNQNPFENQGTGQREDKRYRKRRRWVGFQGDIQFHPALTKLDHPSPTDFPTSDPNAEFIPRRRTMNGLHVFRSPPDQFDTPAHLIGCTGREVGFEEQDQVHLDDDFRIEKTLPESRTKPSSSDGETHVEEKSGGGTLIGAALILGIAIVGSSFLLSSSLDRASDQFGTAMASLKSFKPAAPAAAPTARPGRPDPNKVYQVAVGEAPFIGPKNAKVTIVEFSDFQ